MQWIYEDQYLPEMDSLNKVFKPSSSPEQFLKNNLFFALLLQRKYALESRLFLNMKQRAEYILSICVTNL